MCADLNVPRPAADLLIESLLYRRSRAEREEVLKHKWFESEKAGHDIGLDLARTDWTIKHRTRWLKSWRSSENAGKSGRTRQPPYREKNLPPFSSVS